MTTKFITAVITEVEYEPNVLRLPLSQRLNIMRDPTDTITIAIYTNIQPKGSLLDA